MNDVPLTDDEWMSPEQLGTWLNLKREWIYDAASRGVIPHVRIGRQIRFNRREIRAWLEEQRQA